MSYQQVAQQSILTRYQRAHQVIQCLWSKKGPQNTAVYPTWIGDTDCFWYVRDTEGGHEFRLVNAMTASNEVAFDHKALATSLESAIGQDVCPDTLPCTDVELDLSPRIVRFTAFDKRWQYNEHLQSCCELATPRTVDEVISPDGKHVVYSKEYNLWLRNVNSGEETQLTNDGEEFFAYGTPTNAWGMVNEYGLQVRWSPDSTRIFTIQDDTRFVEALPVVQHTPLDGSIRPKVDFHRFAMPGEEHVETIRLLAIDIASGEQQAADYPQLPVTRNNYGFFSSNLAWWNKDSKLAYFVDVDRYYKFARVVELDTDTGSTKVLFEETTDTQINLMVNGDMHPSYVPLPATNELLWFSERTGWGHLYLYDLTTGKLKNTVTKGDWLVRDVVTVIPDKREAYIQPGSRVEGRNAYYRELARVNIDSGEMTTLDSGDYDCYGYAFTDLQGALLKGFRRDSCKRGTSPTGNFSVVTRSRVDMLPESILLDRDGNNVFTLETAKVRGLPDNWRWPEPVSVTAADGETEIYGVIYRPSDFSPERVYPVINIIFNTPDMPYAPIGAFDNNIFEGQGFFDAAAIAELGFIVVQMNGRGGAYRSKAFKDADYGNLQCPIMQSDQVAALKQLAERYSYMDITNVGLSGHLAGGQGIVQGLIEYPEIFKVGVTTLVHDARLMTASMWGNMFEGETRNVQNFPEDNAGRLQGKLLLLGGMLDTVNPAASVFRIVDALEKANKDFDMVLLSNRGHDSSPYLLRRAWDYYVKHLLGEAPPKEFKLSDSLFSL